MALIKKVAKIAYYLHTQEYACDEDHFSPVSLVTRTLVSMEDTAPCPLALAGMHR